MPESSFLAAGGRTAGRSAAFEDVFDRGPDPQLLLDDDGRVVAVNAMARGRLSLEVPRCHGARIHELLPAAGADPWPRLWGPAGGPGRRHARLELAQGVFAGSLVRGSAGALHVLTLRDAEPPRYARAEILRAVADSSHDAVLALDLDGCVLATSARSELVLGYSERALVGRPLSVVVPEPRRGELDALVRTALAGSDVFQHDTKARRRGGEVRDVTVNLAPLRDTRHGIVGVSVIVQDITERKRLERELRHHSERDPLTGLYNRRHFELELHRAARLAERHANDGAVIVVDVDRFKAVNDTHGHAGGDDVLRALAGALSRSVRDSDVVARLGGDEFAVLLPNVDPAGAATTASKVQAATRTALGRWGSSVSAGAACFGPATTFDAQRVLASADRAMYRAKATGGDALELDGP